MMAVGIIGGGAVPMGDAAPRAAAPPHRRVRTWPARPRPLRGPALLLWLALAGSLVASAQAQTNTDVTWSGGGDAKWAIIRTFVAKSIGVLFCIEVFLYFGIYSYRHLRDQYHLPWVRLRAEQRLRKDFDLEQGATDQHSSMKAVGATHDIYLKLRKRAEEELGTLSPRHGGGNAKAPAPYRPHKQFKRDARSGEARFTAWQEEEEEHEHHEMLLDGRRAALV